MYEASTCLEILLYSPAVFTIICEELFCYLKCCGHVVSFSEFSQFKYIYTVLKITPRFLFFCDKVAVSTHKEADSQIPNYPRLPSRLICLLENVTLHVSVAVGHAIHRLSD